MVSSAFLLLHLFVNCKTVNLWVCVVLHVM